MGQQRLTNPLSGPLNSIRSEATASPEAPNTPASGSPASSAPRASRATPALGAPRAQGSFQSGQPKTPSDPAPTREARLEDNPAPLRASWLIEPGIYERIHDWLADTAPFHWRERARRYGYWRRRAIPTALVLTGVIIAVIVGNFGISIARQVTSVFASAAAINTTQQSATPGSVIISPLNNTAGTPTPAPAIYTVGVWIANTMPTGGSVTVYVRVSQNGAPVSKARVYIQALVGNGGGPRLGPLTTNSFGMATVRLNYGAGQGTPVFLNATTTINGKAYTGSYTFVAY